MITVYLGLGSNVGNRAGNLRRALELLAPHVSIEKKSRVYETAAFGTWAQADFLNMAVGGTTELEPENLLRAAKDIESELGDHIHNEPRIIDIDILLYGDQIIESQELVIPHPRMHERAFVLRPLEEIASFEMHPKLQKPIVDLWDEIAESGQGVWEFDLRV